MAQHTSKPRNMSDIVRTLLNPAMTSHYECAIIPKEATTKWIKDYRNLVYDKTLTTLSCSSATLPGSTLFTHDATNDFTGVTEKIAYRRSYDNKSDFTFYVDSNYNIIKFFEYWMQYIANEQANNIEGSNYHYKVNYPENYRGIIVIDKFDRDYNKGIRYTFVDAYPIDMPSMPIGYERSNVLTTTVSFTYSRYFIGDAVVESPAAFNADVNNLQTFNPNNFTNPPVNFNIPTNTNFNLNGVPDLNTDNFRLNN